MLAESHFGSMLAERHFGSMREALLVAGRRERHFGSMHAVSQQCLLLTSQFNNFDEVWSPQALAFGKTPGFGQLAALPCVNWLVEVDRKVVHASDSDVLLI